MQARDRSEARGRAVAVLMPQQHSHEGCARSRSSYRGRRIPYPGAHLDESWLKLVDAHGTGARLPPIDKQVISMELVTPTKGMIELPREKDLDLFRKVRECAKLLCHSVSCREGEAKRRSASGPCNLHACNVPLYTSHKLSCDETFAYYFEVQFMRLLYCGLMFLLPYSKHGRRITMTMSPCTHQALKLESERLLRS